VLIESLNKDLSAGLSSAITSVRAIETGGSIPSQDAPCPPPTKVVVFGASHMKRLIPFLVSKGLSVADHTKSCWMASTKNNAELAASLSGLNSAADTFFVLDLFGNSTTRYRTPDDSTSPATNMGRGVGWHMLGNIAWASDRELNDQLDSLKPVFSSIKDANKIVLPPIPRYMFGGCCDSKEHAGNTRSAEHPSTSISEHARMRNVIKQKLVGGNNSNMKVLDFMGIYTSTHNSAKEKAEALKQYYNSDHVHLTPTGYSKLAEAVNITISSIQSQRNISTKSKAIKQHITPRMWKGFRSTVGTGATAVVEASTSGNGGNRRHHPYRR